MCIPIMQMYSELIKYNVMESLVKLYFYVVHLLLFECRQKRDFFLSAFMLRHLATFNIISANLSYVMQTKLYLRFN
jgi:hypothetical protein